MITIVAHLAPGEFHLIITGHQMGGDSDGRVCAAVSAISQTCLLGLDETAATNPEHVQCTITEQETPA